MCPTLSYLGNHESDNLNKMYGFEGEVKSKYSSLMMDLFSEVFNWLPLAHCIEGKILVRGYYLWVSPSSSFTPLPLPSFLYLSLLPSPLPSSSSFLTPSLPFPPSPLPSLPPPSPTLLPCFFLPPCYLPLFPSTYFPSLPSLYNLVLINVPGDSWWAIL